ncbi:hypothetical protein HanIR_Chr04g0194651 [Helianthus annuus]|nr:hypothetical protein HanIR_Chr04g0194651 [Helianthus annuus]
MWVKRSNLATVMSLFVPINLVVRNGMNLFSQRQNKISNRAMVAFTIQV